MFVRQWAIVFRINIGRKLKAKAYSSDYQRNYSQYSINTNHDVHLPGEINRFRGSRHLPGRRGQPPP